MAFSSEKVEGNLFAKPVIVVSSLVAKTWKQERFPDATSMPQEQTAIRNTPGRDCWYCFLFLQCAYRNT